jgi:hypothetical protein
VAHPAGGVLAREAIAERTLDDLRVAMGMNYL